MPKKKDIRRRKNNRKIIAFVGAILIIAVLITALIVNQQKKQQQQTFLIQPDCTNVTSGEIDFERNGDDVLFKDKINGYSLNTTSLPEMAFDQKPVCTISNYDFDLYNKVGEQKSSVARVDFFSPINLPEDSVLEDIAKDKYYYIQGEHTDPQGGNYGSPFTSTPLETITLNNGAEILSWENIYTTASTHREGTTASKMYLILQGNKVYAFNLYSWDIPAFNKAVDDFDTVIKTFKPIN